MTRWVLLASFDQGARPEDVDGWMRRVSALEREHDEVLLSDVAADLPQGFGGRDATWDLETAVPLDRIPAVTDLASPGCGPVHGWTRVALEPVRTVSDPFPGQRVKRTLLLTVDPGTPSAVVECFEASLAAMADHIADIRSWALSRVDPAGSDGPWTHVWEQEFVDLDGMQKGYLHAGYHVTAVDRWFDREIPGAIVAPTVAHLVRQARGPVLGRAAATPSRALGTKMEDP